MTDEPTRLAAELAGAAMNDFGALQRQRANVDTRLAKLSAVDRAAFESELKRLLRRHDIEKQKPNFKRAWADANK